MQPTSLRLDWFVLQSYFVIQSDRLLEEPMNTHMHHHKERWSFWKTPALITVIILLIPLLRNLYFNGWDWDLRGLLFVSGVGTLIFSIGLTFQMIVRKLATPTYRAAVGVALAGSFMLVWANFVQAADDVNPAAMMYLWVPLVEIIGAAMARFRPDGMARALFVTALAQVLVLTIVLLIRNSQVVSWTPAVLRGFCGNAFLVLLFVGSALLFQKAGREGAAPETV